MRRSLTQVAAGWEVGIFASDRIDAIGNGVTPRLTSVVAILADESDLLIACDLACDVFDVPTLWRSAKMEALRAEHFDIQEYIT
mmetsp:Transcript_19438/g.27120  ORF Transcript_19438/g.27120 Transcript_19438/m.27120 type:complete len:84 (-) Transcript_19438:84-335(-)